MPISTKLTPLFSAIIATSAVFYVYSTLATRHTFYDKFVNQLAPYTFLSYKWGFDTVYNEFINKPLLEGAYNVTFSLIDKGLLEFAGPTGLGRQTLLIGRLLATFQTGRAYDYAAFMLVSLCCALLFVNTL